MLIIMNNIVQDEETFSNSDAVHEYVSVVIDIANSSQEQNKKYEEKDTTPSD